MEIALNQYFPRVLLGMLVLHLQQFARKTVNSGRFIGTKQAKSTLTVIAYKSAACISFTNFIPSIDLFPIILFLQKIGFSLLGPTMNSLLVFLMTLAILCAVAKGQHQRESDVEEMRAHFDSFKSKTGDFLGEARHEASGFFERIHAKFDAAKGDAPSAFDAAASVIKDNIASVASRFEGRVDEKSSSLCDNYNCCNLSDGDCSIENMPKDETTIVYPDASTGKTTCILGSPYAFQVIPGASDKVLFYFQGGGACWDKVSTAAGMCTTDVGPNSPSGVFDRNNAENPFKDYTIVRD